MFAPYPHAYGIVYNFGLTNSQNTNITFNTKQNNTIISNNKRNYNDAFGQETYDYMRYGNVMDENYFIKGGIGHGVIQKDEHKRSELNDLSENVKIDFKDKEHEEGEVDETQDEYESETDKLRKSIDEKFNALLSILNEIVII